MFKTIKNFFVKKSLQGSIIPYMIVIFFFVVIVVNVVYILLASNSWRGVTVKDSYNKGINYNQTIDQAQKQESMGWKINYRYENISADKKKGRFVFRITDKNHDIIKDASVIMSFRRPTQEGYDFSQGSNYQSGYYYVDVFFPLLGNWEANIIVAKDGNEHHQKRKFIIK